MTRPNEDSEDYWSGPSGLVWIENEIEMDDIFSAVRDEVITRANPQSGDAVLDIGCGTGALSLACATRVGETGRVIASDISGPLLHRAAERGRDLEQFSTFLGDAQTADWPFEPVDMAVSRFGVMFFDDPATAFTNIARALKPGGRMTFATWGPYLENPWWVLPQRVASARLGQPPKPEPNSPGPFALSDRDYALKQLNATELAEVDCETITLDLTASGSAATMSDLSTRVGPAHRIITLFEGNQDDTAAIRDTLSHDFEQFVTDGQVRIPACLNMISARKV